MNKTKSILTIIILVLFFGCIQGSKGKYNSEYILQGNLEGFENGNWIFLILDDKALDSALISENKFLMSGELKEPKLFDLKIPKNNKSTSLWIEPTIIEISAINGNFKNRIITGSKSQTDDENLLQQIREYRQKRDSLTMAYRNPDNNDSIKKIVRQGLQDFYDSPLKSEIEFIRKNPKSYVSARLIDFYATHFGRDRTNNLFNSLTDSIKRSSYGKNVKHFLKLNKNLKIGDKYIDFGMTNKNNNIINLSDFEGKLVLLDFWASWCGPCIAEYPALKEAYSKFKDEGFEIVSLSQDKSKEAWLKAIEKNDLNWVNLWDEIGHKADPYLIYGISGIPDNYLINRNGFIIGRDLRGEGLISAIESEIENRASR